MIPLVLGLGALVAVSAFAVGKVRDHNEDVTITRTWEEIKSVANEDLTDIGAEDEEEDPAIERGTMYPSDPMQRVINWEGILEVNPNIECWIYIPETNIDYPVLRPAKWSDNNYFLKHDVYGNSSVAVATVTDKAFGAIVATHNNTSNTDQTITVQTRVEAQTGVTRNAWIFGLMALVMVGAYGSYGLGVLSDKKHNR